MHEDILLRARWLLGELQLPPAEALVWLKDYYPDLELEERARYLDRARGQLRGPSAPSAS
ncbi:hypothetical protein ACFW1A_19815 [Kitasatospora sp. NPDC058965]|uniref:hypothetical protein n=1 Tax=Kitasatospora sp. NPDC058965 TaxID=3346682 RepID=UPI00369AC29C